MTDKSDPSKVDPLVSDEASETATDRRRFLRLGAVAIPAVVTLHAAPAAAARTSLSNCFIPIKVRVDGAGEPELLPNGHPNPHYNEDPVHLGGNGQGYAPPGAGGVYGAEAKRWADQGRGGRSGAYLNYIRKYARHGSGLSCVVSVRLH